MHRRRRPTWLSVLLKRVQRGRKSTRKRKLAKPSARRKLGMVPRETLAQPSVGWLRKRPVVDPELFPRPIVGIVMTPQAIREIPDAPPNSNLNIHVSAAEQIDLTTYAFALRDADTKGKTIMAWVRNDRKWSRKVMPWPDIYYEQFWSAPTKKGNLVLKLLRRSAIPINNTHLLGKWRCHQVLGRYPETAVTLPRTEIYRRPRDLTTMVDKYQTVFTKPIHGSGGHGISVVWKSSEGRFDWQDPESGGTRRNLSLRGLVKQVIKNAQGSPFVIQQEIPLYTREGRRADIRVTMLKDGNGRWTPTIASGIRLGQPGKLVTNCVRGGEWLRFPAGLQKLLGDRPDNDDLLRRIYDTAELVVSRLEESMGPMGEIGVDLALDQDLRLWFLEANAKPSKESSDDHWENPIADKFQLVMDYARFLWEQKAPHLPH